MKNFVKSATYTLLLTGAVAAGAAEDTFVKRQAAEHGRKALEAARAMVRTDLAERVPQLARTALTQIRPLPALTGPLVVERTRRKVEQPGL